MSHVFNSVLHSKRYQDAKKELIESLRAELSKIQDVKPSDPALKSDYDDLLKQIESTRGRELYYKMIPSGAGWGPFVELADGSIKYDLITGIGVHFFGHGIIDLLESQIDGSFGEVMQGNLAPNRDHLKFSKKLLACSPKSKLNKVWVTTCGATANEIALKIIRQKKAPATKVFAFKDCFAGRTTALQEITDNPKYREGQPVYGEVSFLPFYNPKLAKTAAEQSQECIAIMKEELARYPGKFCALEFEIVQGEGGFHFAPKEFLLPLVQEAKKAGLAIWADEIQTFGRTGDYYCFQKIELDEYVDVVTVAKILQCAAVLYTDEYNPKAGLISGTFSSGSASIRSGIKVLELLENKFVGPKGRIAELEKLTLSEFENLKKGEAGKFIKDQTVVGGMIAFTVFDGSMDKLKKLLFKLWDNGVIAFYCGHGPYRARMLPPFGAISNDQWKAVFKIIEKSILETAQELKEC